MIIFPTFHFINSAKHSELKFISIPYFRSVKSGHSLKEKIRA